MKRISPALGLLLVVPPLGVSLMSQVTPAIVLLLFQLLGAIPTGYFIFALIVGFTRNVGLAL